MKKCCDKIAFMQEGPNWFFQDYSLEHQIWFYNTLMSMDWLYVHNNSDINYYKGLTGKECRVMNSTMVEELIKDIIPSTIFSFLSKSISRKDKRFLA